MPALSGERGMKIMRWLTVCYLGINAWTDARKNQIDLRITAGAAAIWIVLRAAGLDNGSITLCSLLPCAVLFLTYRLFLDSIGLGDVVVVGMMGIMMPVGEVMGCLILGFFMAGVWGMVRRIGTNKENRQIPLVPFLLISYLVRCLM